MPTQSCFNPGLKFSGTIPPIATIIVVCVVLHAYVVSLSYCFKVVHLVLSYARLM
jgi:hypothetical protein